ncbi:MAG: AAA family ATPase [Aliishimia sp.]
MIFRFHTFEMDTDQREIRQDDRVIAIQPKSFALLEYLVERADRMVTKTELLEAFWAPNVSEASLLTTISQVRKAFGVTGKGNAIIRTYHGQGFRFVAPLSDAPVAPENKVPLTLNEQRIAAVLSVQFPDQDSDAARDFVALAKPQVETHQGQLVHMMVGEFTAGFGLDQAYEDCARRALYCASSLLRTPMGKHVSYGIAAGPISLEDHGSKWALPSQLERDATRIAKAAHPGDILLSSAAQSHLQADAKTESTPDGYRLLGEPQPRAGIPARQGNKPTPFVGRSAEMAFLNASAEKLAEGMGQAIELQGPAGIGKSRLLSEFLLGLDTTALSRHKMQCLPGLSNTALSPIRDMCLALHYAMAGPEHADDIDAALWSELLKDETSQDAALRDLPERDRRRRLFGLVDGMLERACAASTVLLVFEDIHWLDATSREYLSTLTRRLQTQRLMLVFTTRPVDVLPLCEAVLHLSPLSAADSYSLLDANGEFSAVDRADIDILVKRAAGNPFFLEELALAAKSDGDPARNLPSTVQAVISVRIAGLTLQERSIIYVLAVLGAPSDILLITKLLEQPAQQIDAPLQRLTALGFLVDDPSGFVFRHMLIQDTAYSLIADADRRALHQTIADIFESDDAKWATRPETLAWHHQEAGNSDRAIPHWIAAFHAAVSRTANLEAKEFARNGLALIDPDNPDHAQDELNLQLSLVFVHTQMHGYAARPVGHALYRAQELNKTVGTPETHARITVGLWVHTWVLGQLQAAIGHAEDLLKIAKLAGSPALSMQANASMGEVLVHTGQLEKGLHHLTEGLGSLEDGGPDTIATQCTATACASYAAWAASLLGDRDAAARHYETSKALSEIMENPFARALHNALSFEHKMIEGDVTACLELANRAVDISRRHDYAFWLGSGLIMRGWALGCQGKMPAAFDALDEGISVFEATGAGVQLANWYGFKAEVLLRANRLEDAQSAANHALFCAERTGDMYFAPRIHAVAAQVQHRLNNETQANLHTRQAIDLAERFAMSPEVLKILPF